MGSISSGLHHVACNHDYIKSFHSIMLGKRGANRGGIKLLGCCGGFVRSVRGCELKNQIPIQLELRKAAGEIADVSTWPGNRRRQVQKSRFSREEKRDLVGTYMGINTILFGAEFSFSTAFSFTHHTYLLLLRSGC